MASSGSIILLRRRLGTLSSYGWGIIYNDTVRLLLGPVSFPAQLAKVMDRPTLRMQQKYLSS